MPKYRYGITFTSDDGPTPRVWETTISADGFRIDDSLIIFWVGPWWGRHNVAVFTKSSLRAVLKKKG